MKHHETNDERLGLDQEITRRDFLNASLIGAGGALLSAQSPLEMLAGQNERKIRRPRHASGDGRFMTRIPIPNKKK